MAATIILLFPMVYFLFASVTFLLARLSDPVVTWLLRGLFATYFAALLGCCAIGILAFASAGHPAIAAGFGLIAAITLGARRWFLRRLDATIRARDDGEALAVLRLRRLHVGGMACNAIQTGVVIALIPWVAVSA